MSFLFLIVTLALFACADAADGDAASKDISMLVRGIAPALLGPAFKDFWDRVSRFLVVYANARHNASCALHAAITVRKFRRAPTFFCFGALGAKIFFFSCKNLFFLPFFFSAIPRKGLTFFFVALPFLAHSVCIDGLTHESHLDANRRVARRRAVVVPRAARRQPADDGDEEQQERDVYQVHLIQLPAVHEDAAQSGVPRRQ